MTLASIQKRIATLEVARAARRARLSMPIDATTRGARIAEMMTRTDRRCLRVAELIRGAQTRYDNSLLA